MIVCFFICLLTIINQLQLLMIIVILIMMGLTLVMLGTLLNPLDPVTSGFWDLVKIHTPQALLGDAKVLSKIANAARQTEQVAQMIRSREAFRASNQALSSFQQQMEKYDQLLQTFIRELIQVLRELKGLMESAERRT